MEIPYGWSLSNNIEDVRGQPPAPLDPFQDYANAKYGNMDAVDRIKRAQNFKNYNPNSMMLEPTIGGLERIMQQPQQFQFQVGPPQNALMQLLGL